MSKRMTCLLTSAALILPLPAFADCAQRIAEVESHPAVIEAPEKTEEAPEAAVPGNEEQVVQEEMVEKGEAVKEGGGETVHAAGGPAEPRENWFTSGSEELGAVLTHLDAAREAQSSGDEKACIEEMQQAEKLLRDNAG